MHKIFILGIILIIQNVMLGEQNYDLKTEPSFIGICSQITRESKLYNPYSVRDELIGSLVEANVHFTRTGFQWRLIHPEKDKWDWRVSDQAIQSAKENDVFILGLIGGIPKFAMTNPIEHIDLWLEFVDSLTIRYKSKIYHWEILNEPNLRSGKYWPQNFLPSPYIDYIIKAAEIIKKNQPESTILLGGLASSKKLKPFEFWESMFKLNVLDYVDGLSYHPYHYPGKDLIKFNQKLKKLISRYSSETKQLWVTEFGVPSIKLIPAGKFSYDFQKNIILQSILVHWATGGSKFFIYSLWDIIELDANLTRKEIRQYKKGFFGLLKKDLSQKPSFKAVKWLSTILPYYNPIEIKEKDDGIIIAVLDKKDGKKGYFTWGMKTNKNMYRKMKDSLSSVKSFNKEINLNGNSFLNATFTNDEVLFWE